MEEISASEAPLPSPRRRGPDLLNALMLLVTVVFLAWTAWIRFGPAPRSEPPAVGVDAPPIRLIDLEGGEPIVLLGLKDKVIWLTFWSAKTIDSRAVLEKLDRFRKRFSGHPKFALIATAVDDSDAKAVRAIMAENPLKLTVYLASPETCRDFDVDPAVLPVHYVIDVDGRILAMSRGPQGQTVNELEEIVGSRLKSLDPAGGARFAGLLGPGSGTRTDVVAGASGR